MRRIPIALFIATLVALTAILGLLSLMGKLSSPAVIPSPPTPIAVLVSEVPTPSPYTLSSNPSPTETVVAIVDGVPITRAAWQDATRLDAVMSKLAGQPPPSAEETLDRLINEILLLRESGLEAATVTPTEVEARISSLVTGWGRTGMEIVSALEEAGLTRQSLTNRVARLILVEQAITTLSARHSDLDAWLAQTRQVTEISLYPPLDTVGIAAQALPGTEINTPETAPSSPLPTLIPILPSPPASLSVASQPQAIAPDFTLDSAQGISITLSDYRGKSNVVLVFYRGQT